MKGIWTITILVFLILGNEIKTGYSQILLEAYCGSGYTSVDVQAWTYGASDWTQVFGQVYGQAYPLHFKGIFLGGELGWQHFMWYQDDTYFYDHNVDAIHFLICVRAYLTEKTFAEIGAGKFFFGEFNDNGLMAAFGYRFRLTEKLSLPVKFRTEIIFDSDANLYPICLSLGLAYSLH